MLFVWKLSGADLWLEFVGGCFWGYKKVENALK